MRECVQIEQAEKRSKAGSIRPNQVALLLINLIRPISFCAVLFRLVLETAFCARVTCA